MNSNTGLKREEKKKNTGEEEKDTRRNDKAFPIQQEYPIEVKTFHLSTFAVLRVFFLFLLFADFFSRELCQIFFSVVKARTSSILQHHLSIITKQFRSSLTLRKLYVYFLSAVMSLNQPFDVSFSVL